MGELWRETLGQQRDDFRKLADSTTAKLSALWRWFPSVERYREWKAEAEAVLDSCDVPESTREEFFVVYPNRPEDACFSGVLWLGGHKLDADRFADLLTGWPADLPPQGFATLDWFSESADVEAPEVSSRFRAAAGAVMRALGGAPDWLQRDLGCRDGTGSDAAWLAIVYTLGWRQIPGSPLRLSCEVVGPRLNSILPAKLVFATATREVCNPCGEEVIPADAPWSTPIADIAAASADAITAILAAEKIEQAVDEPAKADAVPEWVGHLAATLVNTLAAVKPEQTADAIPALDGPTRVKKPDNPERLKAAIARAKVYKAWDAYNASKDSPQKPAIDMTFSDWADNHFPNHVPQPKGAPMHDGSEWHKGISNAIETTRTNYKRRRISFADYFADLEQRVLALTTR